jgi:ATP-dependent DNA helicase RecQ
MRRAFIEEEDAGDERRRREHKRLDALIAYCEAPECRRQMLLRYFGEATEPCGNCDICLDPVERRDGTREAQMVLSTVDRTGQRWGAAHIVGVLRGSESEKIQKWRHDELPTYGAGADRAAGEWTGIIRQMVAAGLLEIDIAGYGGLKATQAGAALMQGEGEFRYRPDTIRAPKSAGRKAAASAAAQSLDDTGADLLQRLKALRLDLAKARDVPAYVIFSDKALIDMAARRPADRDAFAEVYGVGAAKLRDFGDIFLAEIAKS